MSEKLLPLNSAADCVQVLHLSHGRRWRRRCTWPPAASFGAERGGVDVERSTNVRRAGRRFLGNRRAFGRGRAGRRSLLASRRGRSSLGDGWRRDLNFLGSFGGWGDFQRWRALWNLSAAGDGGSRPALVDVVAGVPLAGSGQGVPVGLLQPRAFFELDAVVFQDRALAIVEVGDRLVVLGDGGPERVFGQGQAALRIEHLAGALHGGAGSSLPNDDPLLQVQPGRHEAAGVDLNE